MKFRSLSSALLVIASASCGGGSSSPAPVTPTDGGADVALLGAGAESDPIPTEGSGGMDDVGRCSIANSDTAIGGSQTCIDYDTGYTGASMACTTAGGNFIANESCVTSGAAYVAACTFTDGTSVSHRRFYRRNRSTAVTPAQVQTWCMANNGTYDGPAVPMNTGRCRVNPASVIAGNTNHRTCVNYDLGYLPAAAMADCGSGTWEPGEICVTSSRIAGCQYMADGRQHTLWVYNINRGDGIPTTDEIMALCTSTMGTYVTQ